MRSLIKNTEGATAIEYALLVTLIALAIIYGIGPIGTALSDISNALSNKIGNKPVVEKPVYGEN